MSTSSDQVSRLLALVPYLQAHPGIAVAEVATTFGVSPSQVMKDLQVLWMCGLPGGLPDDLIEIDMDAAQSAGTIHLTNADYLSRPMRFTLDEVMSLVVALRTVAEVATGETARQVASALAKLEGLTSQAETQRVAITLATGAEAVRTELTAAIDAGQRVRLVYDGVVRGQTSRPEVDPVRIDLRDGVGYLQAWSLDRGDWRTYRLDRIVHAETTGQASEPHGEPPAPQRGWFDESTQQVTLALAPGAVWVTEYYPTIGELRPAGPSEGAVETPAGQGLEMVATFPVTDAGWLRQLLLRLGDQARVVQPSGAGTDAARVAGEALALNDAVFGVGR